MANKRKMINSQMNNYKTYLMYMRQMLTLAENVFEFKGLPEFIDVSFLNKTLLRNGAVAFFQDSELGVLALPFTNMGKLDVYGRPRKIQVYASNGYRKILNPGEYIIMYDNNGRYPLYMDILQYAERISQCVRVSDINLAQQKTPRFWKTQQGKEKTIKDMVNNVDSYENNVITYDDINTDDTTLVLAPAPYVADKVDDHTKELWAEFFRFIGIANISEMKKERLIKDEMSASQGGTIASRFSRFQPRELAVKQINEKFGLNIEMSYYDGIPSTIDEFTFAKNEEVNEFNNEENGGESYVD